MFVRFGIIFVLIFRIRKFTTTPVFSKLTNPVIALQFIQQLSDRVAENVRSSNVIAAPDSDVI